MKITIDAIIPLKENMIVKRIKQDSGGLVVLPERYNQRAELVEVIKVSEGCDGYEVGDILVKSSYAGSELDFFSLGKEWDDYRLLAPGNVAAKVDKKYIE